MLQQRAKLHEDEQKALEDQKADAFVAGPTVSVSAKYLIKEKVLVTINLPPKMIQKLTFEFSSVRSGTTHVLAKHNGRAVFLFELKLEALLDMQQRCTPTCPARRLRLRPLSTRRAIYSSTTQLLHKAPSVRLLLTAVRLLHPPSPLRPGENLCSTKVS